MFESIQSIYLYERERERKAYELQSKQNISWKINLFSTNILCITIKTVMVITVNILKNNLTAHFFYNTNLGLAFKGLTH